MHFLELLVSFERPDLNSYFRKQKHKIEKIKNKNEKCLILFRIIFALHTRQKVAIDMLTNINENELVNFLKSEMNL